MVSLLLILNIFHTLYLVLVFPLLTLNMQLPTGLEAKFEDDHRMEFSFNALAPRVHWKITHI